MIHMSKHYPYEQTWSLWANMICISKHDPYEQSWSVWTNMIRMSKFDPYDKTWSVWANMIRMSKHDPYEQTWSVWANMIRMSKHDLFEQTWSVWANMIRMSKHDPLKRDPYEQTWSVNLICSEGVCWPCYIGGNVWCYEDLWEAPSLCLQCSSSEAWYHEKVLAGISWSVAPSEIFLELCLAGFGLLLSCVVLSCRLTT